jgi:chromosome partitioning protein
LNDKGLVDVPNILISGTRGRVWLAQNRERDYKTKLPGNIVKSGNNMKTIAVVSQKGGSGKTTLAVHLAVCAFLRGLRVALIDIDPQGSAYDWNESRPDDDKLAGVKSTAATLAANLHKAATADIDLAIIDTSPHANAEAAIAAQLADFVLIPCRPARFDLKAVAPTVATVQQTRTPFAVVLNAAPQGFRIAAEARTALMNNSGVVVLAEVVHQYAALAHAVIDGRSVHEYEPHGKATDEIDALYNSITRLLGTTESSKGRRAAKKATA